MYSVYSLMISIPSERVLQRQSDVYDVCEKEIYVHKIKKVNTSLRLVPLCIFYV